MSLCFMKYSYILFAVLSPFGSCTSSEQKGLIPYICVAVYIHKALLLKVC
jgi:hypothetical protein